jgi:23S rRNA (adenine2503-C2)-methyltransferase
MPEQGPLQLNFAAPKRGKPPRHYADLAPDERAAAVTDLGLPAFRAKQLSTHYYTGLSVDPLTWTDLPAAQREPIKDALFPSLLTYVRDVSCDNGATVKTLWKLHDGTLVESVLMRYGLRRDGTPGSHGVRSTLCVSSQAGCGMACPFCATGQGGLDRNLSTAEIVDQVRAAAASLAAGEIPGGPGRLNNVVFMGMGEPMANFNAVLRAVRAITSPEPDGLGISARGVTVSTVGLVPRIDQLARRRAARHSRTDQHPSQGRRGRRRSLALRREDQAPRLHRVRTHQGHQRPGLARRPAREGPPGARRLGLGPRQPHPPQPDAGFPVDRVTPRG